MIAAPSSWPRTWPGLSALPTSDTVTWRVTVTSPVSRSTSTSTAVALNSKKAAVPPSGCAGSASLRLSPMPMTSPPSRPSPRMSTSRSGRIAIADPDLAVGDGDLALVDRLQPGGHRPDLRLDVAAGPLDRAAHDHGRATRRGLLVVGHDGGVAHHHGDRLDRHAELFGDDLGEDRPRALAHVGRARVEDRAAVGEEPDGRVGETGRRAGLEPDGDAAAATGRRRRRPADELGRPLQRDAPSRRRPACRRG